MKKAKEKSKNTKKELHPKTDNLIKELEELINDREEYRP